ncbi:hypothetical protein [uncultured Corynebacterium sp.]|uniref:hypothetical protein n=1 Tax=uncultured Corynebacterium sp. TaxID=159447 RepID=UPI0025DD3846|nr:hypothetical protein [uncultured Corynebacterium sp.]
MLATITIFFFWSGTIFQTLFSNELQVESKISLGISSALFVIFAVEWILFLQPNHEKLHCSNERYFLWLALIGAALLPALFLLPFHKPPILWMNQLSIVTGSAFALFSTRRNKNANLTN